MDLRGPLRNGAEHDAAVGDGFITRDSDLAPDMSCFMEFHSKYLNVFICVNNEPKSALARGLGDCRDNKGKLAKRVFTCYFVRT